jgi:secretion/DNA translocation related CpaE-like protein
LWGKKSSVGTAFRPPARALRGPNSPNSVISLGLAVCAHLRLPPQIRFWHWRLVRAGLHGRGMTNTTHTGSTGCPGVLAVLTDSELRNELDRVAAAVGVRIVHAGVGSSVSRRTWSAAAGVVLDQAAADRYGRSELPRRGHVSVLTVAEPTTATWASAIAIGARQVLRLPAQERDLILELGEAAESARDDGPRGQVVAVIGGCGGAGTSLLAVALAYSAGKALLVDLDPWGGGIDLLVGDETAPGLRWPDLALQGGRLNWSAVREALPRHREITVLSGTRRGYELDSAPVDAVVDAGRRGGVTVVCDLPRRLTDATEAVLDTADLVVLVTPCDVRACAATGSIASVLATINPNLGLVVRGPSPGGLRAVEVADIAGLPLLASMKAEPQLAEQLERGGLRLRRRSPLATAARQVLALLPVQNDRAAA